jgi:hypothetical protein
VPQWFNQRFGGGYIVRLLTSRGDQLRSHRCLSIRAALELARLWSAANDNCRISDHTMGSELHHRPIQIAYCEIDLFVLELQDALDQAGADTTIARTPADALTLIQRLDFDAIVVNHVSGLDDGLAVLVEALGGIPTLALCRADALATLLRLPLVMKPVKADIVVDALIQLVRSHA